MNRRLIGAMTLGCGLLALAGSLHAQNYFCIQSDGKMKVVRNMRNLHYFVEKDGKMVWVPASGTALAPAPEYLPVFVAVRNVTARTSGLSVNGSSTINNTFHFSADFESPYNLDEVFFVLVLELERGGKRTYSQSIGRLDANRVEQIRASVPVGEELGSGKFMLHVFVGGAEAFHSLQPFEYRERALDKMVRKRVAGKQEAMPEPFVGPVPEYPAKLLKARTKGDAVVTVRLTPTGVVVDPELKEASDPAFGETALVAVRQWRFLPRIKDGKPVESRVSIPFAFEPPAEKSRKG